MRCDDFRHLWVCNYLHRDIFGAAMTLGKSVKMLQTRYVAFMAEGQMAAVGA